MEIYKNLLFLLGIVALKPGIVLTNLGHKSAITSHTYQITKTWDNRTTEDRAEITVQFLEAVGQSNEGFFIKIEAPFYDEPKLPDGTPPGCYEGLWDYEVVEVFFLGPEEKYLEIELGPRGNYLVYFLEGVRNVTNSALFLEDYEAILTQGDQRWEGTTFVPWAFLPPGINKFNAYAIHKSDPNRVYMSLFPVSEGANPSPDFHFLEPFGSIDLSDLIGSAGSTTTTESADFSITTGGTDFSTTTESADFSTTTENVVGHSYQITKTWDNRTTDDGAEITVQFLKAVGQENEGFIIKVESPFYDEPKLPEGTPPGCYEGLWDYEVVEVFFLGPEEKYLEIELGPRGNYLVYFLEGIRNVTNPALFLENYEAVLTQNNQRWEGTTFVPWSFLPPGINKFNAYAIHKSDPNRVYMSLFPVTEGANPAPDFHFLEPFGSIDLSDLRGQNQSGVKTNTVNYIVLSVTMILTVFYKYNTFKW